MSERILVVDDEPSVRRVLKRALTEAGHWEIVEADCAGSARRLLGEEGPFALVLLDLRMPGETGLQLLDDLASMAPQTVTVIVSAVQDARTAVDAMKIGAYEYVCKPLDPDGLRLTVGNVLRRRQLEIRMATMRDQINDEIESRLEGLARVRRALLNAMLTMAEFRDAEPSGHPQRVGQYSRLIAQRLAASSPYSSLMPDGFIQNIAECAPLHDIGKVGVPDAILLKAGKLSAYEMEMVQTHATIGRDICRMVRAEVGGDGCGFADMAVEITGSHHERWDGAGYPEGLAGRDIPLSARIVGLADFYDACRSTTVYRPEAVPRDEVLAMISKWSGEKFDPVVVAAFRLCEGDVLEAERTRGSVAAS